MNLFESIEQAATQGLPFIELGGRKMYVRPLSHLDMVDIVSISNEFAARQIKVKPSKVNAAMLAALSPLSTDGKTEDELAQIAAQNKFREEFVGKIDLNDPYEVAVAFIALAASPHVMRMVQLIDESGKPAIDWEKDGFETLDAIYRNPALALHLSPKEEPTTELGNDLPEVQA